MIKDLFIHSSSLHFIILRALAIRVMTLFWIPADQNTYKKDNRGVEQESIRIKEYSELGGTHSNYQVQIFSECSYM